MANWERDTPWRQGCVVSRETISACDLIGYPSAADTIPVVVSHDCDLAHAPAEEPEVEIIAGIKLNGPVDGNFAYAKSARRLHITFDASAEEINVELTAPRKRRFWLPKVVVGSHQPAAGYKLSAAELNTLQRWLSGRYRRATFPDEFDRRLRQSKVLDDIRKTLKVHGTWISAILIHLHREAEVVRPRDDDVYEIGFYLVYDVESDPIRAEQAATAAAEDIKKAFAKRCHSDQSKPPRFFDLVECICISTDGITVRQHRALKQLNLDDLSLRSDPPQSMLD